jgi:hypothetical protein
MRMRDVDADAGHEMVFGDRYQHELWAAGGSASTAAQAIHELLLKGWFGVWGKLMRWIQRCSLVSVVSGVSAQCLSPGGACAFCMAERCVHCPISRR